MLFTARDLIPDQQVVTLPLGTSIQKALTLMVDSQFSQIPVVDGNDLYVGLLSEHGIAEHLHDANYHRDALSEVLDRWYDDKIQPFRDDIDVDQILALLKTQDAIVIVDIHHKPIGLVTHFDVAQRCGTYSYKFMLIEYIEGALRRYIEAIYPDPEVRDRTLARRASAENECGYSTDRRPERYEDFTLTNYVEAMRGVWGKFKPYFGPRESFDGRLRDVSRIRNIVMHFKRDEWDDSMLGTLEEAARYLRRCQRQYPPIPATNDTDGSRE